MTFFGLRYYTLIAVLLCLCTLGNAQSKTPPARTLLWQISSKEIKKPSYLFGTIHLICPEDFIWTPAMKRSFDKADVLCMEMDMDDPSLMMEIAVGMIDNSGKTLKDHFTAEQYQKVSAFVRDSLGMDIAMFQQMKPAALHTLFATRTVACPTPNAYETFLTEEALKTKKEVVGLEVPAEQLALFDSMPVDSVIAGITEIAEGRSNEQAEYQKLVDLYKKQDLPAIYEYIRKSGDMAGTLDDFLDVRNGKWIARMTERMDRGAVFFAVGAGHLWGENGLISLLQKEGYTVTPILK